MAAKKATAEEIEERVEACEQMIALGRYNGEIKRAMAKQYGISPRTAESYIKKARTAMLNRRGETRDGLQADAMAFYQSIIRDENASNRDKIRARERIDKLLGLDEPQRAESGPPPSTKVPGLSIIVDGKTVTPGE